MAKNIEKNKKVGSAASVKTQSKSSETGRFVTANGNGKTSENGASEADKATLRAWRLTYESHNK